MNVNHPILVKGTSGPLISMNGRVSVLHFICETLSEGGGSPKGVFTQYPKPEVERQKPAVVDLRDLKLDERRALSNGFPWLLRVSLKIKDFREQIPVFKCLSCPAPLSFPWCCYPRIWSSHLSYCLRNTSFLFLSLPAYLEHSDGNINLGFYRRWGN